MREPVLVIHGVANRDENGFNTIVEKLGNRLGGPWELIPVFWGDLGAKEEDIVDTIPKIQDMDGNTRSASISIDPELIKALLTDPTEVRSNNQQLEKIIQGAMTVDGGRSTIVRGESDSEVIRETIETELQNTQILKYVHDPSVLDAIGRVIGTAILTPSSQGTTGASDLIRSSSYGVYPFDISDPYATRGILDDTKSRSKALLHEIDNLLGTTLGSVLGQTNQILRERLSIPFVHFFGDILVYQGHKTEIHKRIWDKIAEYAPGFGEKQKPINVVAHSLGGVITFDAALDERRPLWIKSLVTFGSQSSFFHVFDPRRGLTRYIHDFPVTLPSTIGRWTNLWEVMDFLAFTVGSVFRLYNGEKPADIPIYNPASRIIYEKGVTHSSYWESEELMLSLRTAFMN